MYQNGFGVAKDYQEAVKWYRKSADQGNSWGQGNLGNMYVNGWGGQRDRTEAIRWLKKAADQGSEYAKEKLRKLGVAVK